MIDANAVTAVVVTYNRLALLQQCLASLCAQTVRGFTVLVVDNASTDGTADYLKTLDMPGLVCCNPGKNLGGAGGFAYGSREAAALGCKAVWIMDDDTLPTPTALETLLAADAAHGGDYGWLSGRALAPDGADQPMNLQRKTMYRDIDGFGDGKGEIPAVMASFVSLFLRVETVRQFGLPIAEFFIWSDDWEREGVIGWLWLLAKDVWHTVQVLRDGQGRRAERIKIIWKGFAAGVKFHPQTPYLP